MTVTRARGLVIFALLASLMLVGAGVAVAAPTEGASENGRLGFAAGIGQSIRDAGARAIDIVADLTGLDVDTIFDRRSDGETLAAIAESEGVDAQSVVDGLLESRTAILDEKVASGDITQEQAETMLANMEDRVTERVNSSETGRPADRGYGQGMGNRAGGGQGMGGNGGVCVLDSE